MYDVFVHTKQYLGKEPTATIFFELPEKEWGELEDTEAWQTVEKFLMRKKKRCSKIFEFLKAIDDEQKFSEMVFTLVKEFGSPEKLAEALK